ncbi:MAG: ATP-dependent DNA helicase [Candidatus Doudnabacteria bacterium]|jgi:DNA helicase-2/ATP-dependent DNA helicase PcrA
MSSLLENLNKQQLEAVTHSSGPLLIVAGAGTGKTTVITKRIAHLIEAGLAKPDEILALTFTEKAAGEMQERADLLLPLGYHDMWISTFHSFCERILQQHGLDIGLPGDFKLLDETKAWVLVHNNLEKFDLDYYKPLGNPKKFISALLKHFSRCKDEVISPEDYLNYAEELKLSSDNTEGVFEISEIKKSGKKQKTKLRQSDIPTLDSSEILRTAEIAGAYHTYQKLLLDNNYLDFGDLINYCLDLFKKRPRILKIYQEKFKFLMVDEFQDTNLAQYELIKLLAGDKCNLTVVGDDDQSIYKFRGASVSNILKFQYDYKSAKQITLVENYRSSQKILDLAYDFIQFNNPDRLEVKLKINKKLNSHAVDKTTIEVIEGKDLSEELNLIAKKILEIKQAETESTWNNFAILLRSNSAADELLPILAQYSIPHTFVANTGLYKKPLIADLIAYFSTLDNFHDSFTLYRVLGFKEFKLPAQDLAKLLALSAKKTLSLFEMLEMAKTFPEIGSGSQVIIQKILDTIKAHAVLAQEKSANEVFVQIIQDLKIEQILEAETLENAENRELLEQFYKKVETFVGENPDKSLHFFLHLLNMEIEAGDEGQIKFDPNLGPESLKVLTVHSAKGLEFEYVFLPNMVDQRFPTRARGDQIEIPKALIKDILPEGDFHLQEERRLFYVGLTRAKSQLYFSWAKDYGGAKTKKPSLFLQETKLVPGEVASQATGKVFFSANPKKDVVFKILPDKFSFSAVKAFQNCPLQYKYQYYLKIPSPGSAYFSFGQSIHKAFELYLKEYRSRLNQTQQDLFAKKNVSVELGSYAMLEELYQKNWVDEWYKTKKQKADYRKKGVELLKNFYGFSIANPPKPKYLEQSFYLPLGDYKFTGKIDRADELPGGGISILDYKTGEKIPNKNAKGDLDQLYIYQWAAEEYLGEKVGKMAYWYLQENKFLEEQVAQKGEIEKLKSSLLKTIEKIIYTTRHDLFKEAHNSAPRHDCFYANLE